GEGRPPKDPRAHALGDGLDNPALSRAVASLEDDADLEAFELDPLLEIHQLDMQLGELLLVRLALHLLALAFAHHAGSLLGLSVDRRIVRETPRSLVAGDKS